MKHDFYCTSGYNLYWIENQTGITVEYFVEGEVGGNTTEYLTLESGQKAPLKLNRSLFKVCYIYARCLVYEFFT